MIVYHGTVDAYLPSIEKEGLKVVPKTRFQAVKPSFYRDIPLTLEPGIYVSAKQRTAANFAVLRAIWLSMPLKAGLNVSGSGDLYKTAGEVIPDAKPIVLKLELDEKLASTLIPDDKSVDSMDAFWTPATIPSSCIKAVLYPKRKVEYWHGSH